MSRESKNSWLSVYQEFTNPFSEPGVEKTRDQRLAEIVRLSLLYAVARGEINLDALDTLKDGLQLGLEKNGYDDLAEDLR